MNKYRSSGSGGRSPSPAGKTREQLKALAWLLDSSIRLPGGFRIGVDALVGLVPLVGDAAGVLLSGYIVSQAARLGVPRGVLLRMIFNVAVEGFVGLIPVVGDVFDAAWKANQRNVKLLESHLDKPAETARSSRWIVGGLLLLVILFMVLMSLLSALFFGAVWNAVQG